MGRRRASTGAAKYYGPDRCHNNLTPAHADAAASGLLRPGIRAVLLHGTPYRPQNDSHFVSEIDRLLEGTARGNALLTRGMAIQGPPYSTPDVTVAGFRAHHRSGASWPRCT